MNTTAMTPLRQVCETIATPTFKAKLRDALPEGVSVDRFTRVTLTAIQQNPSIVDTDRNSLYNSITRCAQDGLQPDGREAALVAFGGRCQYMPMIGGLRKIAAKHGITLDAQPVYDGDEFRAWRDDDGPHFKHDLAFKGGLPRLYYATAKLRDGSLLLEVMTPDQVEDVRKQSRSKDGPAWKNNFSEMGRKTVGRRLFKSLPLYDLDERETSVLRAMDEDFDSGEPERDATAAGTGTAGTAAEPTSARRPSANDKVVRARAGRDEVAQDVAADGTPVPTAATASDSQPPDDRPADESIF